MLIEKLAQNNFLIKKNDYYIVKELYKPSVKKLIAIEAKLNNWKEGFYQALRYQCFSHQSYLALSSEKIKNVDTNLLIAHKIGLISVFKDKIKFIINPRVTKPKNITAYYHLSKYIVCQNKMIN
ncbi:hypothetical protein ACFL4S_00470 [bacterium]